MFEHYFVIVLPIDDGTPAARAAAALRYQLPTRFPEHHFDFMDQAEMKTQGASRAVSDFQVLGSEVKDSQNNILSECAPYELTVEIQAAVAEIVAATKLRNVN
jgi:hypothetical protein